VERFSRRVQAWHAQYCFFSMFNAGPIPYNNGTCGNVDYIAPDAMRSGQGISSDAESLGDETKRTSCLLETGAVIVGDSA